MANNINFKRLIRKYEYLSEELADVEEMQSSATREFKEALSNTEEKEHYSNKDSDEKEIEELEKKKLPGKYKKLFRKIVVKSHPDKIKEGSSEKEILELKEIYETTVEAYDIGEPTPIIVCAIKLDIDVSDFEEDIEEIQKACDEIETFIDKMQSTSAWYYTHVLKTKEEKELFIKKFIELTKGKELGDL